ncbi:MAG TPA: fimbria/pilus periplasmic chaperone [Steroidobacteraceae bacterium]|jgi:chaperone protein EcpD|nr:fimbria/pilus periplasmic chaperone [Steroidobacteraceae bacterium]
MMWKRLAMFGLRGNRIIPLAFAAITLFTAAPYAAAGVVVDGTRVVYPAAKREVTINIHNPGEKPSLVQAWLDAGDSHAKPGESKVPFVLTPPLFRLDPTKVQSLRLVYTQDPLPEDRESLFWLNVLDIPPRAAANSEQPNQLELAFKHRMKVFFRPAGLAGSAADAPARLTWKMLSKDGKLVGIEASNPTAYHVSLIQVTATASGHPVVAKAEMVDPFASRRFDVADPVAAPSGSVPLEYWFVNDYGGNVKATASASAAP